MSGATVELDFWGMERKNSLKSRFQEFLESRTVVRGVHSSLETFFGSGAAIGSFPENGGFLRRESVFRPPLCVPSTPRGNARSYSPPYNNPILRGASAESPPGTPTAPLTIFYKGTVSVFDVPSDKAALIMKLAEEGNLETILPIQPVCLPLSEEQMLLERFNAADLPIARKKSLQRFLEKRKERLTSALPYGSEFKGEKKSKSRAYEH